MKHILYNIYMDNTKEFQIKRLSLIIKDRMLERRYNYQKLSTRTGLNKNWIANIVDGRLEPSANQLSKIAKELDLNLPYLNLILGKVEKISQDNQVENANGKDNNLSLE